MTQSSPVICPAPKATTASLGRTKSALGTSPWSWSTSGHDLAGTLVSLVLRVGLSASPWPTRSHQSSWNLEVTGSASRESLTNLRSISSAVDPGWVIQSNSAVPIALLDSGNSLLSRHMGIYSPPTPLHSPLPLHLVRVSLLRRERRPVLEGLLHQRDLVLPSAVMSG